MGDKVKKKIRILIIITFSLILAGCSNPNDYLTSKLEEEIKENSGILEDQDYREYQDLESSGRLDENGNYVDVTVTEDIPDDGENLSGQIHVTFAENPYIRLTYS